MTNTFKSSEVPETKRYNITLERILANILDGFIILFPLELITIVSDLNEIVLLNQILFWISPFILYLYSIGFHYKFGQTIGKRSAKIMVCDLSEKRLLNLWQAIRRDFYPLLVYGTWTLFLISGFLTPNIYTVIANHSGYKVYYYFVRYFGLLWNLLEIVTMFSNTKRRAIHDYIAHSVVVKIK